LQLQQAFELAEHRQYSEIDRPRKILLPESVQS
jgi:hypothetical protein